jgi:phosphoribosylformimino-5-aminoimidazole carboxamide ribonucleotide (ProFAR) isomerase
MQERHVSGVIVGRALYSGALDARLVAEEFGD